MMAAKEIFLGEFGEEVEDVDLTFGYFGEEIRVNPTAGELTYMDFMARASEIEESDNAGGIKLTMGFLKDQVHPDDWELFWGLAMEKRQTLEKLMKVSKAIVEAVSGFPTGQPSDSRAGRRATAKKSKAGSSRRATSRPREITSVELPREPTAMEILKDRPDLQLVIAKAQESREAQGGVLQAV